jgi:hydrogenase expression/formation protein HypE
MKTIEFVSLDHGSGGKLSHALINRVFADRFGMKLPLTDSAILSDNGLSAAYTTDSYVVDPLFFPGGNIGDLAICGTINDLSVSGATPAFIAAAFIIEEGFPVKELTLIAESMAAEAAKAGVKIVTGDTKVVEKGKCDKLFITTSGIGFLKSGMEYLSEARLVRPPDKLIINGPLGNHSIAVLGARNNLSFTTPVISDCASLNHMIRDVMEKSRSVHFMRDLTRGGLAAVLNELAAMTGSGIIINESSVPVDDPVKGLCEMFGFDPLYLANEGKILIVVGTEEAEKVLQVLRADPLGKQSAIIGEIVPESKNMVILNTSIGGKRIVDMPSGQQLPRIC